MLPGLCEPSEARRRLCYMPQSDTQLWKACSTLSLLASEHQCSQCILKEMCHDTHQASIAFAMIKSQRCSNTLMDAAACCLNSLSVAATYTSPHPASIFASEMQTSSGIVVRRKNHCEARDFRAHVTG
eukprot:1696345-Amphidinium_carterae.2